MGHVCWAQQLLWSRRWELRSRADCFVSRLGPRKQHCYTLSTTIFSNYYPSHRVCRTNSYAIKIYLEYWLSKQSTKNLDVRRRRLAHSERRGRAREPHGGVSLLQAAADVRHDRRAAVGCPRRRRGQTSRVRSAQFLLTGFRYSDKYS